MPELEIWEIIKEWDHVIAAVSTIAAALVVLYRKGLKPVVKHFKNWYDMMDKVDQIFFEISPNGGTSIKDKIDRIDTDVNLVNERQRALLADSEFAHFEMDAEGNYTWVNRTYTRLVKRNPSELMGHGWHNCIAQAERDYVIAACNTALKENRELSITFNLETPCGELKEVRGGSYKMTNPKGETVGFLGKLKIL